MHIDELVDAIGEWAHREKPSNDYYDITCEELPVTHPLDYKITISGYEDNETADSEREALFESELLDRFEGHFGVSAGILNEPYHVTVSFELPER